MDRRDFVKYMGGLLALSTLSGCIGKSSGAVYVPGEDDGVHMSSGGPYSSPKQRKRFMRKEVDDIMPRNDITLSRQNVPLKQNRINEKSYAAQISPSEFAPVCAIARGNWRAKNAIASKMRKMGGVSRITVHHEGNPKPNYDKSMSQVAKSIKQIQKTHFRVMRAGDIAYHFIIDREGRIWQGRDLYYQGAHAKGNNKNNIGIMCLGNFEIQRPSSAQVASLERLSKALMAGYGIPASRYYGHKEMRSTACPGKNLFSHIKRIRNEMKMV